MKIYIQYNTVDFWNIGRKRVSDKWPYYGEIAQAKIFILCAASWERHGWEVTRIDTDRVKYGFQFRGAMARCMIPPRYWDVWKVWATLAPCWVAQADVLNLGFRPPAPDTAAMPEFNLRDGEIFTFQPLDTDWPWGCLFYVTPAFCENMCQIITAVDLGLLPDPALDMQRGENWCDEYLIKTHLSEHVRRYPLPDPCGCPTHVSFPHWRLDAPKAPLLTIMGTQIERVISEWKCVP